MATKRKEGAASTEPRKTYDVVAQLRFDGEDYADGETVDLTESEAKPLLGHTVKPLKPDQSSEG
ncbi:hypothetical protein DBR47_00705 [Paucibacter sp. KBW04]|uniref:hypothetical protein n=1 Tax=Paucibacter sp. KBW04 TaxID=2153361 RepID=UPI000F581FEC|nr:hypothetical protein [Paucibacter sp. KBW04]RQO63126.1 hypothetical protein DBR47_00705 [Paucibacter sp. KBW04]